MAYISTAYLIASAQSPAPSTHPPAGAREIVCRAVNLVSLGRGHFRPTGDHPPHTPHPADGAHNRDFTTVRFCKRKCAVKKRPSNIVYDVASLMTLAIVTAIMQNITKGEHK